MSVRERFDRKLNELRSDILKMGNMVEEELKLALKALHALDTNLANQVFEIDKAVNALRFSIEEECFELIVTQQPAARDLRAIVAVMNMIVDLERMGDQAKGVAKVIPHILQYPSDLQMVEFKEMGEAVVAMLHQSITAYTSNNVDLARAVAAQDDKVDALYASIFTQIMQHMAQTKDLEKVEATYEVLRAARELERFGDLAANVAERVVYMVTGQLYEAKPSDKKK